MAHSQSEPTMAIAFRRLAESDLPMVHRWLNEPGVVRWWEGEDVSWDAVVRDYGPANNDTTEHWIASLDGRDVGWIQCYPADDPDAEDESRHWWQFGVQRSAAGIDYLIGDPGDRGRGLGSAMIRAFVIDIVFGRHPDWPQACASPYAANTASWRALERAGFRYAGTFEDEDDKDGDGPCRLMVAERSELLAGA